MTIQSREQLLKDFETLADEKHHSSVFRASERIRQHLESIPAAISATLTTEEFADCWCPEDCEMVSSDTACPTVTRAQGPPSRPPRPSGAQVMTYKNKAEAEENEREHHK